MKNKTLVSNLVFSFLFLVLLFFSTDIVLSIPINETYHLRKIGSTQYTDLKNDFTAKVESFTENQDIMHTVEFSGFAFIPTGQASPNKTIRLVFISKENRYEVDTEIIDRFNLRDLFNQNNIVGINHGFITRFSPLNMKNGVYTLYIYCYENENEIGITNTNMVFEKTYQSFTNKKDSTILDDLN